MYKCVDLIANVFGKNSETSFFEGRGDYVSPLQYRGVVNIVWLLGGSKFMTFLAGVINERPNTLNWNNFQFFLLWEPKHIGKTETKENADSFVDYLCDSINALFKLLMFPNSLKLADVTPIHKKGMKELKEDYRSVSILPTLSEMFERMFVKNSACFDNVFSKYQCGFRKGYSTQHCNLKMLAKWKNVSVKEKILVLY